MTPTTLILLGHFLNVLDFMAMDGLYVARGHDYMEVGGRVTPGAVTEESEATTIS